MANNTLNQTLGTQNTAGAVLRIAEIGATFATLGIGISIKMDTRKIKKEVSAIKADTSKFIEFGGIPDFLRDIKNSADVAADNAAIAADNAVQAANNAKAANEAAHNAADSASAACKAANAAKEAASTTKSSSGDETLSEIRELIKTVGETIKNQPATTATTTTTTTPPTPPTPPQSGDTQGKGKGK